MSQEHPHSTPGRFFPKPVLTVFNSTGLLQRKSKIISEKNSTAHNTPETPSKIERSKFMVPLNLTPFALTPKLMQVKSNSNKRTPLNQECFSELGDELESSLNNSSGAFSEVIDQHAFSEEAFDQSFNQFLDYEEAENEPDFEMDLASSSPCKPGEESSAETAAYSSYTEPWRSPKVNFLNQWVDDCIGKTLLFIFHHLS